MDRPAAGYRLILTPDDLETIKYWGQLLFQGQPWAAEQLAEAGKSLELSHLDQDLALKLHLYEMGDPVVISDGFHEPAVFDPSSQQRFFPPRRSGPEDSGRRPGVDEYWDKP